MTSVAAAYDTLAPFYDLLTAHHDYEDWTATVERLARRHGLAGTRLLDLACGTGKSFAPFLGRGYAVTACDVSPEMARRARATAAGRAEVYVADLRALPLLGSFDLITCLDDAVNYLAPEHLACALRGIARNLAPGGVAVFDANTERAYREAYCTVNVVADDGRIVIADGRRAGDARVRASFDLLERDSDGRWRRTRCVDRQHHHPRAAVERAVAAAGLTVAGIYGMSWDGSAAAGLDEQLNTKALYVIRGERR